MSLLNQSPQPPTLLGNSLMKERRTRDRMLDDLLDQLCETELVQLLAKRYPYCRLSLQIQDGKVVHADLNLSHKPNSHPNAK